MKILSAFTLSFVIGLAGAPMLASASGDHAGSHSGHGNAAATAPNGNAAMTDGEIKKVDKETGKMTIKHGELKNLNMPAMTMVFQVKDKAMLDRIKAGDNVSFVADKVDGKFTVTQLEAKK